jgi:hypothetical protein
LRQSDAPLGAGRPRCNHTRAAGTRRAWHAAPDVSPRRWNRAAATLCGAFRYASPLGGSALRDAVGLAGHEG